MALVAASPASAWSSPADLLPELERRMGWSAAYLHDSILPSGRFVYRRDFADGTEDHSRYNLLRHAGTLFALADYHRDLEPDSDQSANLARAARFLVNCCIAPVAEAPGSLAVWSDPKQTGSRFPHAQAKLGGAGLALVALTTLEQVMPGVTYLGTWRGLAEFILFMQESDGGFVSKYVPVRGGRDDSWTSLYYPGEAALGLLLLYELDPDPRWLHGGMDALRHLAREREQATEIPADHWALMATARLFAVDHAELSAATPPAMTWGGGQDRLGVRDALLAHAGRIVDRILDEQHGDEAGPCLAGGFEPSGRVSPTATRLEGLLAALTFLPPGSTRDRAELAVARGVDFLLEAQITEGPFRGAFTRVSVACRSQQPRAQEVRIDTVQHALSALLGHHRRLSD
jgi:hypothetical protein